MRFKKFTGIAVKKKGLLDDDDDIQLDANGNLPPPAGSVWDQETKQFKPADDPKETYGEVTPCCLSRWLTLCPAGCCHAGSQIHSLPCWLFSCWLSLYSTVEEFQQQISA